MNDHQAVADLVHRYADAVTHRDADRWAATWTVDATWDLGPGRRVEGRADIAKQWLALMGRFDVVVQTVANGRAALVDGADTGTGRWYVHEVLRPVDGAPEIMMGHYDDRYVRLAGRWLFSHRRLVTHYRGPADLSGTFTNAAEEAR